MGACFVIQKYNRSILNFNDHHHYLIYITISDRKRETEPNDKFPWIFMQMYVEGISEVYYLFSDK